VGPCVPTHGRALFVGGTHKECPDDISVSHIGQLSALPGEASNVLSGTIIRGTQIRVENPPNLPKTKH
jgi:hypothetical protein